MSPRFPASNATRLIVAILALSSIAAVWQNAGLIRERHRLLTERSTLRGEPGAGRVDRGAESGEQLSRLTAAVADEIRRTAIAEAKIVAIRKSLPAFEREELRSYGRIEEMAREAAAFLPLLAKAINRMKTAERTPLDASDSAAMTKLLAWTTRLDAIGALEENPAEIAQFHAATLAERLRLDGPTTERVHAQCEEEFKLIKQQGLARPQRPDEAQQEWYRRRKRALDEASARIEQVIPPEQRERYAVGQSLYLGAAVRTSSEIKPDGGGAIQMALELPGLEMR